MKYWILVSLIFISSRCVAQENLVCVMTDSCDLKTAEFIAKSLGWDEVLDVYNGFRYTLKPVSSEFFPKAFAVSVSNGALSALLLVVKNRNIMALISSIEVANHYSFNTCDLNQDANGDICFLAFPKGTNVETYQARYLQSEQGFELVR